MQTACRCEDCGVLLSSLYSIYSTSQSSTVQYDRVLYSTASNAAMVPKLLCSGCVPLSTSQGVITAI